MLEIKELVKVYKPKKGVPVKALDGVNIKFPTHGMVFLLGKSGCGKSTLLNLLGGLDRYTSGEIIIKGVSSKKFRQSHFDSYRNTYVGFIFQEYNILDEFSVGANVALALQLQGQKATDEAINNILREVDLDGYGNRKPNELSGGQKQRVAIARALVKNPEIIMADEPTGALDSTTGKQVLETLKKLSRDKLVIVVSHDREFAENYADRIIELADGKVISDVVPEIDNDFNVSDGLNYNGNTIDVPQGYHLTEEDRKAINEYIDSLKSGVTLNVKSGANATTRRFKNTDTSNLKLDDGSKFKLIKSKLPLKYAFKMGANALKFKKVRLAFTILLSFIAFTLFGLADTCGAYNHIKTCTNSLIDSEIKYASIVRSIREGEGLNEYWNEWNTFFNDQEIAELNKKSNHEFHGVFVPQNTDLSFRGYFNNEYEFTKSGTNIYTESFSGFVEFTEDDANKLGYRVLAGKLPDGAKDEIAISEYVFETFKKAGYIDPFAPTDDKYADKDKIDPNNGKIKYETVSDYKDMVGKKIRLYGTEFTVTGIVDTGLDLSRYEVLTEDQSKLDTKDMLVNYILMSELNSASDYSYAATAMLGKGGIANLLSKNVVPSQLNHGSIDINFGEDMWMYYQSVASLKEMSKVSLTWVDGEKTTLSDDEMIMPYDALIGYVDLSAYRDDSIGFETDEEYRKYEASLMVKALKDKTFTLHYYDHYEGGKNEYQMKVVGFTTPTADMYDYENGGSLNAIGISDALIDRFTKGNNGIYRFAVSDMPETKEAVRNLVKFCYAEDGDIRYPLQNAVTYELDTVNEMLQTMSKVFLYIGLGFAVFASLMLSNFIATSVSHKKREIGILRAIGSRSNDVFRIFFAESFIIAMINFVLAVIGTGVVTFIVNNLLRNQVGILITILSFGVRQIVLLLALSLIVAAVSSFIPVKRIASKRPIDAIRDR